MLVQPSRGIVVIVALAGCASSSSGKVVPLTAATEQVVPSVPRSAIGERLAGQTDVAPNPVAREVMEYSKTALLPAKLKYCLDEAGHVFAVRTETSSGIWAYDNQLEEAVMTWVFHPYRIDGKPARVCSAVEFRN